MSHPQKYAVLEQERQKRLETERVLVESKERYQRLLNTIPCVLYDYIRWPDGSSRFIYISPKCKEIFEYDSKHILANRNLLWEMVHPEDVKRLRQEDLAANQAQTQFQSEVRIILPSGKTKWIQLTSMPSRHKIDSQTVWSGVILDITPRKLVEEDRERLITELQTALAEIKTLRGIIPICSFCKRIRDDQGYWNQVEIYVKQHSEADFSHSLCPECAREHYPDFLDT